jgi:hypothetical protein
MMTRKIEFLLILLGLCTAILAAQGVNSPGYMDADYYYSMGLQWSRGLGGQEPFLWNYLAEPDSIPTASHSYWSPLSSIIAALPLRMFEESFRTAQIPFILFTSLLPLVTLRVAMALGLNWREALISALLSLAPGYFLPFLVTTDAFSLYAILGGLLFLALLQPFSRGRSIKWLLAGVICGLGHLTRADGFLLLSIPFIYGLFKAENKPKSIFLLLVGYLLPMLPWFVRNWNLFGSPLTAGGSRTLWLLAYDELFSYPAEKLTFSRWLGSGLGQILLSRWSALVVILQRFIAENGLIFLSPFMVIGVLQTRRHAIVRAAIGYLTLLAFVMIVIFPFAGARGGWFHSSIAMMPFLWSMAVVGLQASISWVGRRRGWDLKRARPLFTATAIGLALIVTWGLYTIRVIGVEPNKTVWDLPSKRYKLLAEQLSKFGSAPGNVAINNPPGFYHASGMGSIVLPNEGLEVLEELVTRYRVRWVIIDRNATVGLISLWEGSDVPDWLELRSDSSYLGERYLLYQVGDDS